MIANVTLNSDDAAVHGRWAGRFALAIGVGLTLTGCSMLGMNTTSVTSIFSPYRAEVVQGNFISKEQVDALKPGMSRNQVRDVLGTPLVTSVFHASRWDYVFSLNRQGTTPISRRLNVFFKGDVLERFEGDPMPSETEFVAQLESNRKLGKVPVLEATAESLKPFAPASAPAASAVTAAATPLPAGSLSSYPPLERQSP